LINDRVVFCGVPDYAACRECLARNPHAHDISGSGREEWNEGWNRFFSQVSTIRAFSACSARLFAGVYPEMRDKIAVIPHQKTLHSNFKLRVSNFEASGELVLGVAGNISPAKGSEVVKSLAALGQFRIVVLGDLAGKEKLPAHLTLHGAYEVAELPALIKRYGINMALISSIWPETYNFVADELMSLGIPLACFDLGAPAERISRYARGRVLPLSLAADPAKLGRCLMDFRRELARSSRREAVLAPQ
jgi:glycosyltransferase involved in cell wall biosynthesis